MYAHVYVCTYWGSEVTTYIFTYYQLLSGKSLVIITYYFLKKVTSNILQITFSLKYNKSHSFGGKNHVAIVA